MLLDQGKWQMEPGTLRYLDYYHFARAEYSGPELRDYIKEQTADSSYDYKCLVSCERKLAHLDSAQPVDMVTLHAFREEYSKYSLEDLQQFAGEYQGRLSCERALMRFDWAQLVDLASDSHPKSQPIQLLRRFLLRYQRYPTAQLHDLIREKNGQCSYDKRRLSCERKLMVLESSFLKDLATAPEHPTHLTDLTDLGKLFWTYKRYSTAQLQEYVVFPKEVNRLICERTVSVR